MWKNTCTFCKKLVITKDLLSKDPCSCSISIQKTCNKGKYAQHGGILYKWKQCPVTLSHWLDQSAKLGYLRVAYDLLMTT